MYVLNKYRQKYKAVWCNFGKRKNPEDLTRG